MKIMLICGAAFIIILLIMTIIFILGPNSGAMLDLTENNYKARNTGRQYTIEEIEESLLYVGDSRTVGMKASLSASNGVRYVAESGMSYYWFSGTAVSQIENLLNSEENNIKFVVINMGYNDLAGYSDGNVDKYINVYNNLKSKYTNVDFYYMSVNPVDEEKERRIAVGQGGMTFVGNSSIINFNNHLESALDEEFIDVYNSLSSFSTSDGVHYTSNTYQEIHTITTEYIQEHSYNSSAVETNTCALVYKDGTYYLTAYPQTDDCNVSRFEDNELGLEPNFYNNLMALIEDAKNAYGCSISFSETYRTRAQQKYFYNCYQQKLNGNPNPCNNGNVAAAPGYSNHEYGIAADLGYSSSACSTYMHNNAYKYSLSYPMSYEPWHIQPSNILRGVSP